MAGEAWAKRLRHPLCWHWKGFSPLWLRVCVVRVLEWAKRLRHPLCWH